MAMLIDLLETMLGDVYDRMGKDIAMPNNREEWQVVI